MNLKKNHYLQIGFTTLLITNIPSVLTNPQLQHEANILNNSNYEESKCSSKEVSSSNCLNSKNNYLSNNKLDSFIIKGATYSTKFVPLMNDGSDAKEYTNIMVNDGKRLLVDTGYDFVNSTTNSQIRKIPFFAQTSLNISGGTESDTSFSINSLMKIGELAKDDEGEVKTLAFSQARYSTATNAEGSTTNLGLGLRHRPNDVSMIGANAFWDYRMTSYSDAHSRLGLGGEYLWKDFELRNNWYVAITDEKDVTVKGTSYKERVVDGWDVELGYRLPNYPNIAFYIRGFNWDYQHTQDNSGLEGSVSWQVTPNVGLAAYVSNEISAASTTANSDLPGTDETFFGFRVNITGNPVKFEKKSYKKNMITQMTQPVKRKYDILLERSTGTFQNRAKGN
tara:strand:+ start:618 stop:1799 length:1182 start_codon:yes stop_codon:yes gene_type:complete